MTVRSMINDILIYTYGSRWAESKKSQRYEPAFVNTIVV
jgi:hypothetical protein